VCERAQRSAAGQRHGQPRNTVSTAGRISDAKVILLLHTSTAGRVSGRRLTDSAHHHGHVSRAFTGSKKLPRACRWTILLQLQHLEVPLCAATRRRADRSREQQVAGWSKSSTTPLAVRPSKDCTKCICCYCSRGTSACCGVIYGQVNGHAPDRRLSKAAARRSTDPLMRRNSSAQTNSHAAACQLQYRAMQLLHIAQVSACHERWGPSAQQQPLPPTSSCTHPHVIPCQ
jgi:hypothetical protein